MNVLRSAPAALLVLACARPCCALWLGPRAQSLWLDRQLAVDGTGANWKDRQLDDAQGLSFAFANDGDDLYLFVLPHTAWTKEQLSGDFGQDLTIWLDPQAGKDKRLAVRLRAPSRDLPRAPREIETVGVDASAPQPSAAVGPIDERGGLEARIPLSYLRGMRPQRMSVGLQASAPRHPPQRKSRPRYEEDEPGVKIAGVRVVAHGRDRPLEPQEETYEPIDLWIRVRLARPPGAGGKSPVFQPENSPLTPRRYRSRPRPDRAEWQKGDSDF